MGVNAPLAQYHPAEQLNASSSVSPEMGQYRPGMHATQSVTFLAPGVGPYVPAGHGNSLAMRVDWGQ